MLRSQSGKDRGIYVQVPAYRDSEVPKTLIDLYAKAEHPELLRVCVVWQRAPDEALPASVRILPGLELIEVPFEKSRGCNWARHMLQARWRDEPYTLLIDSHHRFAPGFDTTLVDMLCGLRSGGVAKPILTCYLPSYEPDREPGGRKKQPYKIYPLGREQGLLTDLTSHPIPFWKRLRAPIEADFASLHMLFAAGTYNREIPFHPAIYFRGDEVVTSLRAYTHGYDMFHPHVIVGWHCYDRKARVPHWNDHEKWYERHWRSLRIIRQMFRGVYSGEFGVGHARSVKDYENRICLDLVEDAKVPGQHAAPKGGTGRKAAVDRRLPVEADLRTGARGVGVRVLVPQHGRESQA